MMLLKMSLLIPYLMMQVAVLTTIRFSLIFFSCSYRASGSWRRPTLIKSQNFFSMSMTFVRSAHLRQLVKPVSFCHRELLKTILVFLSTMSNKRVEEINFFMLFRSRWYRQYC